MGLEVVVRPVVFPNIRPARAQSLPPLDDPDKGFAEINGNGATEVTLSNSYSASASSSQRQETKRQVDVARVYQKDQSGKVNKDNFVDIEVANKIWMQGGGEKEQWRLQPVEEEKNIEITKRDKIRVAE
jgi:hypothetical protein